jgi:uncharacterized protein
MGAKLQALFALQEIELQIVDIRRQLARQDRRVAAQQKKLKSAQEAIETERLNLRRSQVHFDELDVDIKGRSTNIERLREHLNAVRTNKDYAAFLSKMNTEKADVSKLEAKAMEAMQGLEIRKKALAEQEQAALADQEKLDELQAQLRQAGDSFSGRLSQLERQRDEAAQSLGEEIATLFTRLSERYEGEVLAEVERTNPRRDEFICAGCHMSLRVEVANMLKSSDEIVTCKSCGRILFMDRNT